MHGAIRLSLATVFVLCPSYVAAGEPTAQELLRDAMSGDYSRPHSILDAQEELLQAADAKLTADTPVRERAKTLRLMCWIGTYDATHAFKPERVQRVVRLLGQEADQYVIRCIADYLEGAANSGHLPDHAPIVDQVKRKFQATRNLYLGHLLLRLAPHSEDIKKTVKSVGGEFHERHRFALLAAAGDVSALLELVDRLELKSTSRDRELHLKRSRAIKSLEKALAARAVGPLIEYVRRDPPFPPSEGDMMHGPLSGIAVLALRNILLAYPDIVAFENIPESKKAWLVWWESNGKGLPGLDIRTSTDEIHMKRFPVLPRKPRSTSWSQKRPGAQAPRLTATEIARRDRERELAEWNQRVDDLVRGGEGKNALGFYKRAGELAAPSGREISAAFVKVAREGTPRPPDVETALRKMVTENQKVLTLIRKGLACGRCEIPPLQNLNEPLRFPRIMMPLYQLLVLEGKSHEHRGAPRKALECYVDVVRLSRHLSAERLMPTWALSVEVQGWHFIRQLLSMAQLGSDDYAWLCGELSALGDTNVSAADTIQEAASVLERSCETMTVGEIADVVAEGSGEAPPDVTGLSKEELLLDAQGHSAAIGSWLELPYAKVRDMDVPESPNWIVRNWLPPAAGLEMRRLSTVSEGRATLLAAALLRHRASAGGLPATIAALNPTCLARIPLDPFTEASFKYRRQREGFIIYSCGPDLDDDGAETRATQPGSWAEPADGDLVYEIQCAGLDNRAETRQEEDVQTEPPEEDGSWPPLAAGALIIGLAAIGGTIVLVARARRSRSGAPPR